MKTSVLLGCGVLAAVLLAGCGADNQASTGPSAGQTKAQTSNDRAVFSIQDALNQPDAVNALDPAVRVQAGAGGGVVKAGLTSRQSANAVGRSVEAACHRAFLNAALQFQKAAKKHGGTRVTNIRTYYGPAAEEVRGGQYVCTVGKVVARVSMKADIAR